MKRDLGRPPRKLRAHAEMNYKTERELVLAAAHCLQCPSHGARPLACPSRSARPQKVS